MNYRECFFADVFTSTPFEGNQLAVFTDGEGLTIEQMQTLAHEINFSESTFLFPGAESDADFRVRIFTPWRELPFAGHPIVGTAHVIADRRLALVNEPLTTLRLETGVGIIPVEVAVSSGNIGEVWMTQRVPHVRSVQLDPKLLAESLGVATEDVASGQLPIEMHDNGIPVLIVPLVSLEAARRVAPSAKMLAGIARAAGALTVLTFTLQTELPSSTVHARVFAPEAGIAEDPATGSASGPLGVYLVRHDLVDGRTAVRIQSEQGIEMKRPSILLIHIESENGEIRRVRVGGHACVVGEGRFVTPHSRN